MEEQPYLRHYKLASYKAIYNSIQDRTGKIGVNEFQNVTIVPKGQIVDIQNMKLPNIVIDDIDYCCEIVHGNENQRAETVLYAGYFRHQWGHFLLNSTARLWWLSQDRHRLASIDKIIFIATPGESSAIDGNYKEFFELLGVYDKVEVIKTAENFRHVIVPDISFEHNVFFAREMLDVFKDVRDRALKDAFPGNNFPAKKLFITRTGLEKSERREVNLRYFDNLFQRNGFEIIHPEKLGLRRFILQLADSEKIVSVSGSTAHNLIFASKESEVSILERCAQNNVFQINITKMKEMCVSFVDSFLTPIVPIATGNVFFYFPSNEFKRFLHDKGLSDFSEEEKEEMTSERSVFRFIKSYRQQSGNLIGSSDNAHEQLAIAEAYNDTLKLFKFCLGLSPLKYYLKRFLKK